VHQYILKPLLKKSPYSNGLIPSDEIRNILIVKQHNQMGDMLCTLPLFAAVRRKFPKAYITLVASKVNCEIIDSPANRYIDKILVYDKSSAGKLINFYKDLRAAKNQISIVPSTFSFSHTSHLINFLSGAKTRVGVRSTDGKYNKYEYLLNIHGNFRWEEKKMHQVQRHLDIGRLIGCNLAAEELKDVKLELTKEEINYACNYIGNKVKNEKPIIGFHPGAGKIQNRWHYKNFADLIKKLYKDFSANICITSGPADIEVIALLKNELNENKIVFFESENKSLRFDASVISKLDLYITNDTGPMHIANYLKTPLIALFGPTDSFEWGPSNSHQKSIQSPTKNINDIDEETVYNNAIKILKDTKKI